MIISQHIAMIVLAIACIAYGLAGLGVQLGKVPPVLALIAGIVLLIAR